MNEVSNARRLEQSPDTVTSMTQPDVGPAEVVERCVMLSRYMVFVI